MYTLSLMLMFYVKLFMKYGKASFLFSMAAILNIAKNGGSIKIPGCFHQNSEIVWHGGHLCQMSCFCPYVKMYYIKSPHYCSFAITVFRHVVFGHLGFLIPGCVHLRATLGILSLGILGTCPSQLNLQRLISRTSLLQPIFLWSFTLYILLGQNIQQIFSERHRSLPCPL